MASARELRLRAVRAVQKYVANPVTRRLPWHTLLETTGRKSGLPRRTPVGGRRIGDAFWMVSEHGYRADYVRNIRANPRVRVRLRGRWYAGTAVLLPDDDPLARNAHLGGLNAIGVRLAGVDRLTIRIDLDEEGLRP